MTTATGAGPRKGGDPPTQTAPPQDLDAERDVLGAILTAGAHSAPTAAATAAAIAATGLTRADFLYEGHALIYEAARTVIARGDPSDVIVVKDELHRTGQLANAGGENRLREIAALVPSTANAPAWARSVIEHARRRRELQLGNALITGASNGGLDTHPDLRQQLATLLTQQPQTGPAPTGPFMLAAHDFIALQTRPPRPLWGDNNISILPEGGLALLAGRPGVGKTTLLLDLACHLATGIEAYGYTVSRPLRILIIENEGPLEMFRQKLAEKLQVWPHDIRDAGGYIGIHVLRWGSFSFAEAEDYAAAQQVLDTELIDLVIGDPLSTLGMEGVGSPAETRAFVALIKQLGLGTTRSFLFLHHFRERVDRHEDELAKISGAWGGHLDTLLTISATGSADQARLAFPKLRWRRIAEPKPLILGRVFNTASFEVLGVEDDPGLLEPFIFEHLKEARRQKLGYSKQGWRTATQIADKDAGIGRRRSDIVKCLEQSSHLFISRTGEAAKAIGAKKSNAVLWGLREWDEEPDTDDHDDAAGAQVALSEDLAWR